MTGLLPEHQRVYVRQAVTLTSLPLLHLRD